MCFEVDLYILIQILLILVGNQALLSICLESGPKLFLQFMKKESLNSKEMELGCSSEVIVNIFGPTSEKNLHRHSRSQLKL